MEVAKRQGGRLLRATTISLLALCLASAPAMAQQHDFVDPAHDVTRQTPKGHQKKAPHRSDVDIRDVTIRHGVHRIAIGLHVRELEVRRFSMGMTFYHNYTRETAVYPNAEVRWHPKHPHRDDVYIEWDLPNCVKGPGPDMAGRKIRLHTNYRKNYIHLSFPRRCISGHPDRQPRWIRARIAMYTWSSDNKRFYSDDVSYSGTYPPSGTLDRVSPRVYKPKD